MKVLFKVLAAAEVGIKKTTPAFRLDAEQDASRALILRNNEDVLGKTNKML
jgi:hypothetical protein